MPVVQSVWVIFNSGWLDRTSDKVSNATEWINWYWTAVFQEARVLRSSKVFLSRCAPNWCDYVYYKEQLDIKNIFFYIIKKKNVWI